MADKQSASSTPAKPGDPLDLETSVAGEEDPGASIDLAMPATGAQPAMAPGDQAPAGSPGTGENVCPQCGGTGRLGASACPNCQGSGKVIVGIGGA
jgi:hypothetical protein